MEEIIQNIIIKQNKELLKDVAKKLGLDEEYILKKYYTPRYYILRVDKYKDYPLKFIDKIKNDRSSIKNEN